MSGYWKTLDGWDAWYDIPSCAGWTERVWFGVESFVEYVEGQRLAWAIWEAIPKGYDFPKPGLYFDAGCRTAGETYMRVIGLAQDYGFVEEVPDGEEPVDAESEFVNEVADEAIDYLNSLETREGYSWGYGENAEGFGLWMEIEE